MSRLFLCACCELWSYIATCPNIIIRTVNYPYSRTRYLKQLAAVKNTQKQRPLPYYQLISGG